MVKRYRDSYKNSNQGDLKNSLIAGVDEAGRGPLAGPVVAAAVILDPCKPIKGLADSKILTEKERERLFHEIREKAFAWAARRATVSEIDSINILQATFLAMQRAVQALRLAPHEILVDGNMTPIFSHDKNLLPARAIIKGDQTQAAISAASIVAKVLRDRIMRMLDKKYPQYGFARHKGYSTVLHMEALEEHGPCRVHRRSFAPVTESLARKK